MSKHGLWIDVEPNSTVTITTKGKTAADTQFVGGARFLPSTGDDEKWDINPGPKVHTIAGSMNFDIRVGFRFPVTNKQSIVVTTTLTNPDGSIKKTIDGKNSFVLKLSGTSANGLQRGSMMFIKGDNL